MGRQSIDFITSEAITGEKEKTADSEDKKSPEEGTLSVFSGFVHIEAC